MTRIPRNLFKIKDVKNAETIMKKKKKKNRKKQRNVENN